MTSKHKALKARAQKFLSSKKVNTIKRGVNLMSKLHGGFKGDDQELKERREYKGRMHGKDLK